MYNTLNVGDRYINIDNPQLTIKIATKETVKCFNLMLNNLGKSKIKKITYDSFLYKNLIKY